MIADHSLVHGVVQQIPFVAVIIVGLGYLVGSWRRGLADTWKETVAAQETEITALKTQNQRLSEESSNLKAALKKLEGMVEQLRIENAELRQLVMLERVPPALSESLTAMTRAIMEDVSGMHENQVGELSKLMDEKLHPIAQGISRLLTQS